MWRNQNSAGFISCLKYIKGCILFQVGPLSLTLVFIQKIFLHFQTFILNLFRQKLSHTSRVNDFLRKLQNLPKLPDDVILCTTDGVGLYSNIPNEEGLLFLKKVLDKRRNKTVFTESLIELAEIVLRNNYFEFNDRFKKQKEDTAIGTKFALPLCHYFHGCLRGKNFGVPY